MKRFKLIQMKQVEFKRNSKMTQEVAKMKQEKAAKIEDLKRLKEEEDKIIGLATQIL